MGNSPSNSEAEEEIREESAIVSQNPKFLIEKKVKVKEKETILASNNPF